MKKIRNAKELRERIEELELIRELEKRDLKEHVQLVKESLRPKNLVKSAVKGVSSGSGVGGKITVALLGLAAGYLAKKAVFGLSRNPLRKVAGTLLQMGVASVISRNSEGIGNLGGDLLSRLFKRNKRKQGEILEPEHY